MKKSFSLSAFALLLVAPVVALADFSAEVDSNNRVNAPEVLEGAPRPTDPPDAQPVSATACCNTPYVAPGSFADPHIHTNGRVGTAVQVGGAPTSN